MHFIKKVINFFTGTKASTWQAWVASGMLKGVLGVLHYSQAQKVVEGVWIKIGDHTKRTPTRYDDAIYNAVEDVVDLTVLKDALLTGLRWLEETIDDNTEWYYQVGTNMLNELINFITDESEQADNTERAESSV